jgi:hypothetical protein
LISLRPLMIVPSKSKTATLLVDLGLKWAPWTHVRPAPYSVHLSGEDAAAASLEVEKKG